MKNNNKTFFKKWGINILLSGILLLLITVFIVFNHLKYNSNVAEFYTRSFTKVYLQLMTRINKYIPFSLTELFFVILGLLTLVFLILFFKSLFSKKWAKAVFYPLTIAVMVMSVIVNYNLVIEMAYLRKPVDLPYYEQEVDNQEFIDIYNYYASDFNYCLSTLKFESNGNVINPYSLNELSEIIEGEYSKKIDSSYFLNTNTCGKEMFSSFLYREFQITGVAYSSFGEANINVLCTNAELPIVIAHELAHTKAVMREDDANQVAFFVCLNSDNPYLRFSAYISRFSQINAITSPTYISEEDREQKISISHQYYDCYVYIRDYWQSHNLLERIGDFFNNMYISSSGISEGTSSYSGGTEVISDPETGKLIPNKYQKLYFEKYYRINS